MSTNQFHAHAMSDSHVGSSKKSKFINRSKFIVRTKLSYSAVFSLHQYFIETKTDIDMLLQV